MMPGDMRNKEVALTRIKRLASSGLPVEPFVRSVFELINQAIPNNPNRSFHVGSGSSDAYICSTPELKNLVPLHTQYFVESPAIASGMKIRFDAATMQELSLLKTVWHQDEIVLSSFYKKEGFNAVFRPVGFHHVLIALFQEAGQLAGCYPIWRSADQKAFSRDDAAFVRAITPHIAHGLKAATQIESGSDHNTGFAPIPGWDTGAVLMDHAGRPVAMDLQAKVIFQQLGVLDGFSANRFAAPQIRDAFEYVTRTLDCIFQPPGGDSSAATAPVYRLYHHWSGIVLKLRGTRMIGAGGAEYTVVLVERGESAESRRRRLLNKWNLSNREAEVLDFIAQGKTGPEISILLGISHDTARKHTSRILEKLGVETRTAAAAVASETIQIK